MTVRSAQGSTVASRVEDAVELRLQRALVAESGTQLRKQAAAHEVDLPRRATNAGLGRGHLLAVALGHLQRLVERQAPHRQ